MTIVSSIIFGAMLLWAFWFIFRMAQYISSGNYALDQWLDKEVRK